MSLKVKIALSSAMCVFFIGLFSNIYLYVYLTGIISEKAANVDALQLNTIENQFNWYIGQITTLGSTCRADGDIAKAMGHKSYTTKAEKQDGMKARDVLNTHLSGSNISNYINKMLVFNDNSLMAQGITNTVSRMYDPYIIRETELFKEFESSGNIDIITISPSISDRHEGKPSIIYLSRVIHPITGSYNGWLYLEVNMNIFSDVLLPYEAGSIFLSTENGIILPETTDELPAYLHNTLPENDEKIDWDGKVYKIYTRQLNIPGVTINSCADVTFLEKDGFPILYTLIVVVVSTMVVAVTTSLLLSGIITRPLQRLTDRIQKISNENDFSFDPDIEKGGDEIARVGKVVNEMNMSICHLLKETEEMYEQKKNDEITLLQSQINPHFLYNTLDSVRWMAEIQGMQGIVKTVSSLSNLLRNLAKGVGNKITLREELSLLTDYVNTQSVRFMEMFTVVNNISPEFYDYTIIKFTLQPLLENAIFHGLEPAGYTGKIVLNAYEKNGALCITVEDNGVGMTEEELAGVLANAQTPHLSGMSGIGVANVNSRLKLVYGSQYGLSYESEKGKYTKVTICIPKEVEDV